MKMLFSLFCCLYVCAGYAQSKADALYVFDASWKPAEIKKAAYLLRVHATKEKNYEWTYYNMFGPRIRLESFSDEAGKIRNGICFYYRDNGELDSAGGYISNVMNGPWSFYREGNVVRQKDYENGTVVKDTAFAVRNTDSLKKLDPVPGEIESAFRGGDRGWMQFLNHNFTYPDRAVKSNIAGTVILQFIIDTSGSVRNPEVNRSVEYSLDEEALRIINKSPQWNPASKDGRKLKSYKIQPIIFRLTGK